MILFVANHPGGYRAILPVYQKWQGPKILLISQPLQAIYSDSNTQIFSQDISCDEIRSILQKAKPNIIVTATSVVTTPGGQVENIFRQEALHSKTPSIAIVDHWCNYADRFSLDSKLDSLPDTICVIDERSKSEMLAMGFEQGRIRVTGQPAFDTLINNIKPLATGLRISGRNKLNLTENEKLFVFVSEPIKGDYGSLRGYDELLVLKELIPECDGAMLIIKPHPRDAKNHFDFILNPPKITLAPQTISNHELIATSDLLIGMTSLMLFEGMLLRKPAISFQPHAKKSDPWYSWAYPAPVATTSDELMELIAADQKQTKLDYSENDATGNILKTIKTYLI